jgi:hypothetical protein
VLSLAIELAETFEEELKSLALDERKLAVVKWIADASVVFAVWRDAKMEGANTSYAPSLRRP